MAKPKSTKPNKSAFIRSMPNATAAEIIAAAKGKGMTLSSAMVYVVRSKDKGAKRRPGRPKGSKNRAKRAATSGNDELAFRRLVLSIGLLAAEKYLAELRASVRL